MFLTIVYRLPGLPGAVTTACKALLWAVAMPAAVALCVAVLVVLMPHLPTLFVGVAVTGLYAVATCPRTAVRK